MVGVEAGQRLLEHVERAGGDRVEPELLAASDQPRQHDDRGGAARHDRADRVEAAHQRQEHVHRDHVGAQLHHQLDRAPAIAGLAHDLEVGRGGQQLAQDLAEEGRVVDDRHAHGHGSRNLAMWDHRLSREKSALTR